jgi:DNA-binding FrmR family transcriptional regulator
LPTATTDELGSPWWILRSNALTLAYREPSGERCQMKVFYLWGRYIGLMLDDDQTEVIQRLRSAKGHLGAIIGMLEIGEPCEVIFHQLGAVQAALHAAGEKLLSCQIKLARKLSNTVPALMIGLPRYPN